MIIEGLARENNLDSQIHTLPLKRGNGGYFALSFAVACGNCHEIKIRARNYLVRVGTKFLHHSFKEKKRPCLGGGKHDRSYVSAPRCVSGGEEAKRVLADIAREEVSAVSGIFGSTREEVSGSKTGV